ncbi:hypothetical protein Mtc_1525 [Methanocella conradii HZ254]|uniref:Glycosyltransferase RgtA/B/C/D-like domain-containing protein n=1 Tax=Methanocella conradii (strain DSM 24694 / JCM 17849 / CGMCC 1.5162 / HZ254) TaxID=1041930 RepID=H8I643_METCZ|nr:hypothetical protein [Methanocella conradii]AFD00277.1 hypothetical protein Mtc_1525 [Methanocella conradii HZ254]
MYLLGIPGVLFLGLTALFGYTVLKALNLPLKGMECVVASPVAGIIVASWLCLLPYLLSGSIEAGILISMLIMLAAILWIRPSPPILEKDPLPLVAAIAIVGFAFMFFGLFTYFNGEYHAAFPFYGDAAFHAAVINSFSEGYNEPPSYPMMAGQPLRYTFLIDFYSAALNVLGLGLQWSVVLPGWLLLSGLLSLIYFLGARFIGRRAGGVLAVTLLALSGGLGFLYAISDWHASGSSIIDFVAKSNLNYTTKYELGIVFTNFLVIVLAQRTALVGFSAGALVMLVLYAMLVQRQFDGRAVRNGLLACGVLAGLLPLFHVYSYISIMLSSILLLAIFKERKWYLFMAPAILLAMPQALWISGQMGVSHFHVQLGWMAGSLASMPEFWVKNMGLELFLLICGFFTISRKNLKFYLPFLAIFIMANVFVFQPWDYDNHKFFSFWLMPSVLLMASSLLYVYRIRWVGKPLFAVLLAFAVLTGALVAAFIIGHPYVELSKADLYAGGWIIDNTPRDSVFLTSDSPIHAVTTVAGRKSYLGYEGWLYTHGIDYSERLRAEKKMFGAYDENETLHLLKDNGIDYVFIGPSEINSSQFYVNEQFFEDHFPCVFNWTDPEYHNTYRIFKVIT